MTPGPRGPARRSSTPAPSSLLPGGVNSPVRAMKAIGRDPLFVAEGAGAELVDVDGNRYVDWMCSWGPLIAGHAHPAVVEAVTAAARRGTSFGAPTEAEVELAAEVAERVPGAEMVRMVNSGTEASMSAIRLARAATGREKLLKFAGAYHGHVDGLLAEAGSGLATAGIPASPGVPPAQAAATVIVPWNDREAVERRARASTSSPRSWPSPTRPTWAWCRPTTGSSSFLREEADANGALLVFDEVISGFRVARGGAQEREGVTPDLTVLGKVIGGGLPGRGLRRPGAADGAGGAGGRRLPGGHAVGQPAGHRRRAGDAGAARRGGLRAPRRGRRGARRGAAREPPPQAGRAAAREPDTGLLTLFFRDGPVRDYDDAKGCDSEAPRRLLPRDARARRLPAALAVRGLVPLARPHRRARGAHPRRRARVRWRPWRA